MIPLTLRSPQLDAVGEVSVSTVIQDAEWDAFVDTAPGGGHLQTSRWAQIKARSGWQGLRLRLSHDGTILGGCQLLVRRSQWGTIGYCPRGPLARDRDEAVISAVLDALEALALREKFLYLKVQPPPGAAATESLLLERGFVVSAYPSAQVATVRVDVQRDPAEVLAAMRPRRARYIRRGERIGVTVRAVGRDGLPAFGVLLDQSRARKGASFSPYSVDVYGEMLRLFGEPRAQLFLAEHNGEVISATFTIAYGDTVVDLMSAWSGRHTNLHVNELMHWRGMQWARDNGYRYFDFDGIQESVARAMLAGARVPEEGIGGNTAYKLGMGGDVVVFPSAYDRSFHPLLVWPTRILAPRLNPGTMKRMRRLRGRELGRAS